MSYAVPKADLGFAKVSAAKVEQKLEQKKVIARVKSAFANTSTDNEMPKQ